VYFLKQLALFEAGEISATEMRDRVIRNAARQPQRRPAIRTLRGWAISVLQETGAIRECEEHGWMQERAGPHTRERALAAARRDPPDGVSPDEAIAELCDVLDSIGDTCPECPPEDHAPRGLEKCQKQTNSQQINFRSAALSLALIRVARLRSGQRDIFAGNRGRGRAAVARRSKTGDQ
jgi:hypothetical protein